MKKKVKVIIKWDKAYFNRRPFEGLKYSTVAKFKDDLGWPNDAWSVTLTFAESPKAQGNPSMGFAEFLSDDAPEERLFSKNVFELYEGESKTAIVEVT